MAAEVVPGFLPFLGWAIFLGSSALAIALGVVLSFHWFRYAMNPSVATTAAIVYGAGCIIILAMLLGSVLGLS